eukprot:TRINITY_DN736_c0_g2_i3.p1 TRINITY_DN736_c0_g2~~TRINITY_DN736_c0_g2_i3.p1  ORF type:complete len:144 (+),score=25.28 TRINITY_DN736_c0_g2_i3:72-503(+)
MAIIVGILTLIMKKKGQKTRIHRYILFAVAVFVFSDFTPSYLPSALLFGTVAPYAIPPIARALAPYIPFSFQRVPIGAILFSLLYGLARLLLHGSSHTLSKLISSLITGIAVGAIGGARNQVSEEWILNLLVAGGVNLSLIHI